jgi:PAS domain-containing protein
MVPDDLAAALTPPVIAVLIALGALTLAAGAVLWRQHRHWRRAEADAVRAEYTRTALQAALETAPEGYFAWFHTPAADAFDDPAAQPTFRTAGYGSRRLAVLLDLFRGLEATFAEVCDGFDADSRARLIDAVDTLRDLGTGFTIGLTHTGTGRRIQARGLRAVDDQGRTMADVVWMSDVTEGVAAVDTLTQETADLTRERNLLKAALDGISEPVWLRDDDLSLIYCNAAYVKAVDAKNAGDVVARGREIAPRVAVREARALAAAARAAAETRKAPFHMVLDGSRRLMEVTESPVDANTPREGEQNAPLFSDGSGRLTAGFAYDITRQEELETRLKREAAAHADVLERLTTAIAIFGPDTRLVFFNAAFSKLWRLDPGWLLDGPTYGSLLDTLRGERKLPEVADFPAYKDKELARFNSLIEPIEDVLHLPDGGTLRRVVAPHPMGGLLGTYEDVTDKLALERSYNTLIAVQRETIDNLQEAVAVFGADGQLRLANPAFAALWELSLDALREGPALSAVIEAFRDFFEDTNIWARHRAVMLNALAGDRERAAQQGRVVRSDGSVLEFISVPLPDGGVLFCYNDVSAPERVAQALRGRAEVLSATDKLRTEFITNVAAGPRAWSPRTAYNRWRPAQCLTSSPPPSRSRP